MGAGIGLLLGALTGLKASSHTVFRISTLVQLLFCGLFSLSMLGGSKNLAMYLPAAIGAGLHLLNMAAVAVSLARRRPYPWDFVKWTFSVATIAFVASILGQLYIADPKGLGVTAIFLITAFLLPGILQSVLLWWPRLKELEAALEPG